MSSGRVNGNPLAEITGVMGRVCIAPRNERKGEAKRGGRGNWKWNLIDLVDKKKAPPLLGRDLIFRSQMSRLRLQLATQSASQTDQACAQKGQ